MAHRLSILKVLALLATAVLAVSTTATTVLDDSRPVPRPLSEFLQAQGSFDDGRGGRFLSVPPVQNFLVWTSPRQNRAAAVDYAGLANQAILEAGGASLGTTTEGTVLERPLTDGRVEITVTLHTRQALTWVIEGDGQGNFDFGAGTLLFGHRVPEVLGGARPALGDSLLEVVFTNPSPGAPLPDLEQILFAPAPGQELRFISFFASASDPLREGSGVPDGTPERMEVTQSGLLMTPFVGAVSGGFAAERVDLFTDGRASTTHSSDDVAAAQPACRGNRPCNDGNPCTSGDRCKNGVCVGTPYSCNDGNVCTTDTCNGAGGCTFTNNTAPCSDGNACTQGDTCSGGICVSGPPTVCNDGNVCTTDSCGPASGCLFTNNNSTASCNDGNACTHTDACSGGACSGTTYTCNDGNVCTDDACDGAGGCTFTNNTASCNDGNACTLGDACINAACAGTSVNCDDGNACTTDRCDGAGGCSFVPGPDGAPCDDGIGCTANDICAAGVCRGGTPVPDGTVCDDGNGCTANEACTAGLCQGTPVPDGTVCDDGDACTDNDACTAGLCTPSCDSNSCLVGLCPDFSRCGECDGGSCAICSDRSCFCGD